MAEIDEDKIEEFEEGDGQSSVKPATTFLEVTLEELIFLDDCIGMQDMDYVDEISPEATVTDKIAHAIDELTEALN